MKVGDMHLIKTRDGYVDVLREDGDEISKVGQITAQGLHEAAELADQDLADAWEESVTNA